MCCTPELNFSHFLFRFIIIYFFLALREWALVQRSSQRRPLFPFNAVTLLCNQLLQYGLELPKQIGHPTKHRTTVVPHCGSFCRHSLSGAECTSSNEWNHRGWGGQGGGGASSSGDGGGGGQSPKPHKNSRTIRVQGRAALFPPPRVSGFLCADKQAGGIRQGCPLSPYRFQSLLSINSPHRTSPNLCDLYHRGTGIFFYPPLLPSREACCLSVKLRAPFSQHFSLAQK